MNTILVTGGLGYIGSHVCVNLLNNGYSVIVIDNLSNSSINVLDRIKKITSKEPIFYQGDIINATDLLEIFNNHQIDSVMHFAGLKSVSESIKQPLDYYNNNIVGSIKLLEVMSDVDCKSIVFSSSATVYGKTNQVPIKENSSLSPENPYGQSKLLIESLLNDLYNSDNSWQIVILRYFNPAGAHESGLIGESPNGIPNNLFPYIAGVASGSFNKLSIFGNDYDTYDGTGVRDYIHVEDLARGHLQALKFMKFNSELLVLNLGTGKGYSVLEILRHFELVSNVKIPYEFVDRRQGDVSMCFADPSLASEKLNWEAQFDLTKMCQDTWKWHKNSIG